MAILDQLPARVASYSSTERARFLITMYVGIGDAVTVGLSALDQLLLHLPAANGTLDVLCNDVQAELFMHDPRVNRVIDASRTLFPAPEVTAWLHGIVPDKEMTALLQALHAHHYEAVVAGMFAPGLYARLHSHIIAPRLGMLWQDFHALRHLQARPMSSIVRRAIDRYFAEQYAGSPGSVIPMSSRRTETPLYLTPHHVHAAYEQARQIKAHSHLQHEKLLVVSPDTASAITRPPTELLASALIQVLERRQDICICVLPSYTDRQAAHRLYHQLAPLYVKRVVLLPEEPRATLLEVAALLDQADIFVTGDTGLMHLAATTKLLADAPAQQEERPRNTARIVAIFGGTNPAFYASESRTAIVGRGRKEQMTYRPGIAKESYHLHGRNLFDHIAPEELAQVILEGEYHSTARRSSL